MKTMKIMGLLVGFFCLTYFLGCQKTEQKNLPANGVRVFVQTITINTPMNMTVEYANSSNSDCRVVRLTITCRDGKGPGSVLLKQDTVVSSFSKELLAGHGEKRITEDDIGFILPLRTKFIHVQPIFMDENGKQFGSNAFSMKVDL